MSWSPLLAALGPLLALALPPTSALAQKVDCSGSATTVELNFCASQELEAADRALNDAYAAAIAEARSFGPFQEELLREAQRAWIAFRDAACSAEGSLFEGGTIQPLVGTNCKTRLTLARTEDLWTYAEATP